MTIKETVTAAEEARMFWRLALPDVEAPELSVFYRWTKYFSDATVSRGSQRAARKHAQMKETATPMTANDAHRYCTSVMVAESREQVR
jgi:hypothetical protein